MNIKLSICISVHNTEKYLRRCLDSVINQSYSDIEIVLVDNGSTDNSIIIMRDYEKLYPHKIKIIQQVDLGLAQGRNSGVENATGDFIAFVDADDYLELNAFEILINKAISEQADIVGMKALKGNEVISSSEFSSTSGEDYLRSYFKHGKIPTMLWLRIYKKSLFSKQVFPHIYTNNEDNFALPCLIGTSKKITFVDEILYHYTVDNDNAYMVKVKRKELNLETLIKRTSAALKSVNFIQDFFGSEIDKKFSSEFQFFLSRNLNSFLFQDLDEFSVKNRLQISTQILKIDRKKYKKIILMTVKNRLVLWLLISFLGLNRGISLYLMIKKTIRKEEK